MQERVLVFTADKSKAHDNLATAYHHHIEKRVIETANVMELRREVGNGSHIIICDLGMKNKAAQAAITEECRVLFRECMKMKPRPKIYILGAQHDFKNFPSPVVRGVYSNEAVLTKELLHHIDNTLSSSYWEVLHGAAAIRTHGFRR